jgi:hypothetical protein
MLPTKFRFIWPIGFRGEDFFKSANQKQEYSHFNILFSKPCQRQYELLPSLGVSRLSSVYFSHFNLLPTKFRFIWPSGFRGEDFFKSANQKQELPVVAMSGNGS